MEASKLCKEASNEGKTEKTSLACN